MFLKMRHVYSGRLNAIYATHATRWAANRANSIVCASTETQDDLCRLWGISRDKIAVVPYGVADSFFSASSLVSNSDPPYFLFVGTFEARKGLDVLASAWDRLGTAVSEPVRLVLAGRPGWGTEELLARLRGNRSIQFEISPPDDRLAQLYAGALALVHPSRAEGFGLPVAEAMAAGCPVITSDLSAIRAFAHDVPTFVRVGDPDALAAAMWERLSNPAAQTAALAEGRRLARHLSWRRVGDLLANLIDRSWAPQSSRTTAAPTA
jgi:glycosyltransferase involved in cell wall biosynthesis